MGLCSREQMWEVGSVPWQRAYSFPDMILTRSP